MKFKKISTLLLSAAMLFSVTSSTVLAAESESNDDLKVTISTDKNEYAASENVDVTITIENVGNKALYNVNINAKYPTDLKITNNSATSKTYTTFNVGAKESINFTTKLDTISPVTAESHNIFLWVFAIVAAGALVIRLFITKKKVSASVFMCIMILSALFINTPDVQAAETSLTVNKVIKVNNVERTLSATITYSDTLNENTSTPSTDDNADKKPADNAQVENGGFETGDLTGWTPLTEGWGENAEGKLAGVVSATSYWGEELPFNQAGNYHLDGWNIQDCSNSAIVETSAWSIKSSVFTLDGSGYISVKMGGAAAAVKVYLKDGTLVGYYKQNRFNDANFPHVGAGGSWADMGTYVMDLSAYIGQEMYIELCDEAIQGGWAVAFFDDVVTYYATAPDYKSMKDTVMDGHTAEETPAEIQIPWQLATNLK